MLTADEALIAIAIIVCGVLDVVCAACEFVLQESFNVLPLVINTIQTKLQLELDKGLETELLQRGINSLPITAKI